MSAAAGSCETVALPPLYARWIGELLLRPIPPETRAKCSDCPMCSKACVSQDIVFNIRTKCCTFQPELPNFLVGEILADGTAPPAIGRSRLIARFHGPAIVRPLGVSPSLAEAARSPLWSGGFGMDESMLCPYYLQEEGGLCGIWQHRNARCSTWFCRHVRGAVGRSFWRTLKELLAAAEEHLSIWCLQRLEAGTPEFRALFDRAGPVGLRTFQSRQEFTNRSGLSADFVPARESRMLKQHMWGKWLGDEERFFHECFLLVVSLDWDGVAAIGGEDLRFHSSRVQQAFAALLHDSVPRTLRPDPCLTGAVGSGVVRAWGYSRYDPIDIPGSIFEVLSRFDGRPTEEVLEWIAANTDIQLSRETIRTLWDFGILTDRPPDEP